MSKDFGDHIFCIKNYTKIRTFLIQIYNKIFLNNKILFTVTLGLFMCPLSPSGALGPYPHFNVCLLIKLCCTQVNRIESHSSIVTRGRNRQHLKLWYDILSILIHDLCSFKRKMDQIMNSTVLKV